MGGCGGVGAGGHRGVCVGAGVVGGGNNIGCGAGVGWDNMKTIHPTFKTIHPTFKTVSSTSSSRNTCYFHVVYPSVYSY